MRFSDYFAMNTSAQIQQPSPIPTIAPPLVEGSLFVAVAVYIIKEGVAFFKQKDASEDRLTTTLIQDLRAERNQQLQQMIGAISQISQSQRQVAGAIQKMSAAIEDINIASQQNARIHSEIFAQLRNQERILLSLNEKVQPNGKHHTPQP
jgi:hypothetical protein